MTTEKEEVDQDAFQRELLELLETAVADFNRMRSREGETLQRDLLGKADRIEELVAEIEAQSGEKLKAYREGAPRQLIMLYILSLLGTVVYIGVEMAIVGQNLITSDLVMSIMISVFMIFVNTYYFRNRRHLFHN